MISFTRILRLYGGYTPEAHTFSPPLPGETPDNSIVNSTHPAQKLSQ